MGETFIMTPYWPAATITFSILKRIVMGETKSTWQANGFCYSFQYPQADRDG